MAFSASLAELISTKPKPRERPVARSVMTDADSHVPTSAKSCSRSALVVANARLPTYNFLPMTLLLARPWGRVRFSLELSGREVEPSSRRRGELVAQNNLDPVPITRRLRAGKGALRAGAPPLAPGTSERNR